MGEKMFHNIPKNIVVAGRIVRQFLMVTLALDGGKRGGKLLLLCPTIWNIIAVYLHTETTLHTTHYTLNPTLYTLHTKTSTKCQVSQ